MILRIKHAEETLDPMRVQVLQLSYFLIDKLYLCRLDSKRLQEDLLRLCSSLMLAVPLVTFLLAEIVFKQSSMAIEDELFDCILLLETLQGHVVDSPDLLRAMLLVV